MRVVARFATWHIPLIVLSTENNSVVEKNRKLKLLKINKKRKRKRRLFTGVRKLQETVYITSKKNQIYGPVYGWGSTAARLQPLQGGSLLFTSKFPEIPGTHFIDLRKMKS